MVVVAAVWRKHNKINVVVVVVVAGKNNRNEMVVVTGERKTIEIWWR